MQIDPERLQGRLLRNREPAAVVPEARADGDIDTLRATYLRRRPPLTPRHERVNAALEIEASGRHFFGRVEGARFLSFYTYIEATRPRRDVCRSFFETQAVRLQARD